MAVLSSPPTQSMIRAARGHIDFACWKGIWYARKWPYTPPSHMSPLSLDQNALWAAISRDYALYPAELVAAADAMVS